MEINQYRISELAEKVGVTKRTIHYYMGRGLLPSPNGAGLGTTYSDEHLYRIMLIKKLQDAYLPLEEIKKRMSGMSIEDVRRGLEGEVSQMKLHEKAAGYRTSGNANANANLDANANANYDVNADVNADVYAIGITNVNIDRSAGFTETAGTAGTAGAGIAGIQYERLVVGFGLEIHFPSKNGKARGLAEMLYKYAEKMMKEG